MRVRNSGEEAFCDAFNGKSYQISSEEVAEVPEAAVKLWLGDWTLEGRALQADQRRAKLRSGGRRTVLKIVAESKGREPPKRPSPQKPKKKPGRPKKSY